ncbi:MAG: hypothetical protein ACREF4_01290, partial [Gammaproteobacteria bacterium]
LRIVVTLRADFITRFVGEDFPAFRTLLERRQLWLGPMSEDDLREAVVFPAKRRGAFFEKGLVEMILRDMRGHTTALPLLEESLAMLWAERRGPWLTLDAYLRTGGVGGALASKADALYEPLSDDDRRLMRRIFLGLIHLGEGVPDTRRRVAVVDLLGAADRPEDVEALLRRFSSTGGSRLISLSSADGTVTAELTHEALIHHWSRLRRWLDEGRADLRLQRRVDGVAQHWRELDRPDGSLWRPPDLDLLRAFVGRSPGALTQLQLEFYDASRRAEEQRQHEREQQAQEEIEAARQLAAAEAQRSAEARGKLRFKYAALVAGVLALLAAAAAGLALRAENLAEKSERQVLNYQIDRYERIPVVVSGLATPMLSDGYPFTEQNKEWAIGVRKQLTDALGPMPVGTADVLGNWARLLELIEGWDPAAAGRSRPDPDLQEAARNLARSVVAMWNHDARRGGQTIYESREFLAKRRRAYAKDLGVLRTLVEAQTLTESDAVRRAYLDFWRLYWGELLIVEDPDTETMMAQVGFELFGGRAPNPGSWVRTGQKPATFNATAGRLIAHLDKSLASSR